MSSAGFWDDTENSTRVVKELKHLERNCNTASPEEVKLYVANKN
jgi:hypothetical protein